MAETLSHRLYGVPEREVVASKARFGYGALVFALCVEFARPQDWVPALAGVPVGIVSMAAVVLGLLMQPRQRAPIEPVFGPFVLLLAMMAAWVPLATNNYWAFTTLKLLVLYGVVMVGFTAFVTSESRLRGIVRVWIAALCVQGLHAVIAEGKGTGAYFGDENDLALAMNVGLALSVCAVRIERSWLVRAAICAAAALFLAGIVASNSRSGLVGLCATGAVAILLSPRRGPLLLAAGVAAIACLALAPEVYWREMATIFDERAPTRIERFRHWSIATEIFAAHPIVGVGQGNLPWVAGQFEVFDTTLERSLSGRAVHSAWFTLLAELGVVGALLYAWIGAETLRAALRAKRRGSEAIGGWAAAFVTGGAAWASCGLFLSTLYYPHAYYLLGGILAARRIAERDVGEGDPDALESSR